MTLFDKLFKAPAPAQQQAAQQQQPNPHVQANPTVPTSANTPQLQQQPGAPAPESLGDQFKDLWSNNSNTQNNQAPNFNFTPEQLNQFSSKIDFTRGINPEDMTKISQGGEEALKALGNILNQHGQNVFGMAAQLSGNMANASFTQAQKSVNSGLPDLVNKQLARQDLYTTNPNLRDPSVQPVVEALQAQIQQKYPNATPQEVNAKTQEYIKLVATAAGAMPQANQQQQTVDPSTDFSSFIS